MNPYLDKNTTLTQAASDQELGKQYRAKQEARAIADQETGLAYEQGGKDALAKFLNETVYRPQQEQMTPDQMKMNLFSKYQDGSMGLAELAQSGIFNRDELKQIADIPNNLSNQGY